MPKNQVDDSLSGLQKAAILLISLGPEKSALIFKHLKEDEIEELTLEIANLVEGGCYWGPAAK